MKYRTELRQKRQTTLFVVTQSFALYTGHQTTLSFLLSYDRSTP